MQLDKNSLNILLLLTEIIDNHCICTKKAQKIYDESINYICNTVDQYLQRYATDKDGIIEYLYNNCEIQHNPKIGQLCEEILLEIKKWWEQNAQYIIYKCKEYEVQQRKKEKRQTQ